MARWQQADLFAIPLLDGGQGLGQVVHDRGCPEGAAWLALGTRRHEGGAPAPLALSEIQFLGFVGTGHLEDGTWPVLGFDTIPDTDRLSPWRVARVSDPTLAAPVDPVVAEAFVNALHGLLAWDAFPDNLFDKLLLPGRELPGARRP